MIKLYNDGNRLIVGVDVASPESQSFIILLMQEIANGMVKLFKDANLLIITIDDISGKNQAIVKNLVKKLGTSVPSISRVPAVKPMQAKAEKAPDLSEFISSESKTLEAKKQDTQSEPSQDDFDKILEKKDIERQYEVPDFIREAEEDMVKLSEKIVEEPETVVTPENHDVKPVKKLNTVQKETSININDIKDKSFESLSLDELTAFFKSNMVKSEMDKILEEHTYISIDDFLISSFEDDIRKAYTRCIEVA